MKENQNCMNEPAKDAGESSLGEEELDGVSGGFTILDMCQNRWAPVVCNAPWGQCPHLDMKRTGEKCVNQNAIAKYLVSCDKGCFKDIPYNDHLD